MATVFRAKVAAPQIRPFIEKNISPPNNFLTNDLNEVSVSVPKWIGARSFSVKKVPEKMATLIEMSKLPLILGNSKKAPLS